MPMAPSAMMHEQCCTWTQLAGQRAIERAPVAATLRIGTAWPAARVPECQALQPIASASFSDVAYCDLADDTPEPGNTSGPVAIVRRPDEPKDWATLCCAEGCVCGGTRAGNEPRYESKCGDIASYT